MENDGEPYFSMSLPDNTDYTVKDLNQRPWLNLDLRMGRSQCRREYYDNSANWNNSAMQMSLSHLGSETINVYFKPFHPMTTISTKVPICSTHFLDHFSNNLRKPGTLLPHLIMIIPSLKLKHLQFRRLRLQKPCPHSLKLIIWHQTIL